LPIDRVFTISGFGTVVTGTLIDGTLQVGQEVEIVPTARNARIRGLQTHKHKIEEAEPGSRVAINLTGVSKEDIETGQVVTVPGWLRSTRLVDVQLRLLADAPRPLKHNTQIDFFCGAAELPARVRLLGVEQLAPGETGWAQLRLSDSVALVRGDRFIIRQLSPSVTIGGGQVVDPFPGRRHRRFRSGAIERLETLAHGTPNDIVLQALERRQPREARELVRGLSLQREVFEKALGELLATEQVLILDDLDNESHSITHPVASTRYLISARGWRDLGNRMRAVLASYHKAYPLRRGMPREELRSQLQKRVPDLGGRLFNQVLARASHECLIGEDPLSVWLSEHKVRFSPEQQAKVDSLLAQFSAAPYTTPSVTESVASLGHELFDSLLEKGVLVRLSPDVVYLAETLGEAREKVGAYIRAEGSITIADARDILGTSRKYAVALMEYLDSQRVTKRVGDERILF
jgi:selenocysteine-specific elongation factor